MEAAYVLFHLQPRKKKEFVRKVREVKGVTEARLTIGIFDAIARIEADSIEALERIYFDQIEKIDGIHSSGLHFVACPRTRK
jgi:DNA-binding Lrp family transcriptional regulator